MLTHPIVLAVAALIAFVWVAGAILVLVQMRTARYGYEDENGFHFAEPIEEAVVPADDVRPSWLTGALADRFCGQRAEIFAC